jgi:hypothetical protein
MRNLELGAFEPVRAIDDVRFSVGVEVTDAGPFAEIGFAEGLAVKGVDGSLRELVLGNTRIYGAWIYGACQEPSHAGQAPMRKSPGEVQKR